jgi:uncharacterized protein (TIGR04255 family)
LPIELPAAHLQHLPGSPLKLAIAQVRFRPDPAVETAEKQVELGRVLADEFELESRDMIQTLVVQIGAGQVPAPSAPPRSEQMLRFIGRGSGSTLAITQSSVGLETGSYRTFDEFVIQFQRVLEITAEVIEMRTLTRLGVRYVNEIEDERLGEAGGLAAILTQPFLPAGGALGLDVRGGLSELIFEQADGLFVLRCGLVDRTKYLLDMDYYSDEERDWDLQWVLARVRAYHEVIESVFAAALRDEYREEIGAARGDGM